MPYFLILILIVTFLVAGIGIKRSFSETNQTSQVTSEKVVSSSRGQIEDMLGQLEKKEAPEEKMGAMCYSQVLLPEYFEYTCPLDGEKTVYDRLQDSDTYWILQDIVEMRRLVSRLNSLTKLAQFQLDERLLCGTCFPGTNAKQRYVSLITRYPDAKQYKYDKISTEDLSKLIGFFEYKLSYQGANEGELPLKGDAQKIKQILGVDQLPKD